MLLIRHCDLCDNRSMLVQNGGHILDYELSILVFSSNVHMYTMIMPMLLYSDSLNATASRTYIYIYIYAFVHLTHIYIYKFYGVLFSAQFTYLSIQSIVIVKSVNNIILGYQLWCIKNQNLVKLMMRKIVHDSKYCLKLKVMDTTKIHPLPKMEVTNDFESTLTWWHMYFK